MALAKSHQSTCRRRAVGCILVDRHGHVRGTGYNGVPSGWAHCIDHPCPGASAAPGTGLSSCEAIHAEANALLQCSNVDEIDVVYCTDSPCLDCVKLLLNTSARHIVFLRQYPHPAAEELWTRKTAGVSRAWTHYPDALKILHMLPDPGATQ